MLYNKTAFNSSITQGVLEDEIDPLQRIAMLAGTIIGQKDVEQLRLRGNGLKGNRAHLVFNDRILEELDFLRDLAVSVAMEDHRLGTTTCRDRVIALLDEGQKLAEVMRNVTV